MSEAWLHIIGVGDDGLQELPEAAKSALAKCTLIIGGDRHLAMLSADDQRPRVSWPSPLLELVDQVLARRGEATAILATGDPMHYGIGVTFAKRLSSDEIAVYPASSAFSLAAARLCWDLSATQQMTLHGRPLDLLRPHLFHGARIMALSDNAETPEKVANLLCESGFGESLITVLEHMGGTAEKIRTSRADRWNLSDIQDLNTIAIDCAAGVDAFQYPITPGLPDDAFFHDGQLTKSEIRGATLSALHPFPGMTLWDIGAGCGSISVEWMRCHPRNMAIAVEKRPDRLSMITANRSRLGVPNLKIIEGSAPACLKNLAAPDRIFIGGGLQNEVFAPCYDALKPGGILVANTVTIEGERLAFDLAQTYGGTLKRLQFARAQKIGGFTSWKPFRQVTQLSIRKS